MSCLRQEFIVTWYDVLFTTVFFAISRPVSPKKGPVVRLYPFVGFMTLARRTGGTRNMMWLLGCLAWDVGIGDEVPCRIWAELVEVAGAWSSTRSSFAEELKTQSYRL